MCQLWRGSRWRIEHVLGDVPSGRRPPEHVQFPVVLADRCTGTEQRECPGRMSPHYREPVLLDDMVNAAVHTRSGGREGALE